MYFLAGGLCWSDRTGERDWQSSGYSSIRQAPSSESAIGVGGVTGARGEGEVAPGEGCLVTSVCTEGEDRGELEAHVKFCKSSKCGTL